MSREEVEKFYIGATVAIQDKNFSALKKKVEDCPECVYYTEDADQSLLHVAAALGTPEMIEYLVKAGADINLIQNDYTPLSEAVRTGRVENVKTLISLHADLDAEESVYNPLIMAIVKENVEIARLLINAGIDLTIQYATRENDWWDVLSFAKYNKQKEIEKMILDKMKADGISYDEIEPLTEDDMEEEETFDDYLEKYLGEIDSYYEDEVLLKAFWKGKKQVKNDVEIYINVIMPDEERDYITLVTEGMSEEPMVVTAEGEKFAELVMKLPSDWHTGKEMLTEPEYSWPLKMMSKVAYLAHVFEDYYVNENTVIPYGLPNDAPMYFDIEKDFTSVMLCKSEDIPPYEIEEGVEVEFFTLIPITEEEKELVKEHGSEEVKYMLSSGEIVDLDRAYLVPPEE